MASDGANTFGQLLRRYRLAAGLTQEELAARSAVAVRTISDLERGVSRRAHPSTIDQLAAALPLQLDERATLESAWRAARPHPTTLAPSEAALPYAPNNVPEQLTRFIGREREMEEVMGLLTEARLVTLTGPGGCGKTRLAYQTALRMLGVYPDGVWVVELAPLADADLIPLVVASALKTGQSSDLAILETLKRQLHSKRLLLALDNCEHLIDGCAQMAESLLQTCPGVTILATSREPLAIAGERTYLVPPLGLPDQLNEASPDHVAASEAAALLIERLSAAQPQFTLSTQNAPAVARICRQLDGMPLALEMVAPLSRTVTIEQIADRLDDRFALLTQGSRTALPRHQTLRAVIDWSYNLLFVPERILFRRLAVFRGDFTLDATEGICSDAAFPRSRVIEMLSRLVDKSLARMEQSGGTARYSQLESIRQYGNEKLDEVGEIHILRQRHMEWYVSQIDATGTQSHGAPRRDQRVFPWREERSNLQAALAWSRQTHDVEAELCLLGALYDPIIAHGGYLPPLHGRRLEIAQALARSDPAKRSSARARALSVAGQLAGMQGDLAAVAEYLEESSSIFRELGNEREAAGALLGWGQVLAASGDYEAGLKLQSEVTATFRGMGDEYGTAMSRFLWGDLLMNAGDYHGARPQLEESAALFRELGDEGMYTVPLLSLARVACAEGDFEGAFSLAQECLATRRAIDPDTPEFIASVLVSIGEVERCLGLDDRARQNFTDGLALYQQRTDPSGAAWANHNLGHLALRAGDRQAAAALFIEALQERATRHQVWGVAASLAGLASVAAQLGKLQLAAQHCGSVEGMLATSRTVLSPVDDSTYHRDVANLKAEMGEEAFAAARLEGMRLTVDEAVSRAFDAWTTRHK
jgi:predicted ATPase/DNA-binding XRE family transcriptional regulator